MLNLLFGLTKEIFLYVAFGAFIGWLSRGKAEKLSRIFIDTVIYAVIPFFLVLSFWTTPPALAESSKIIVIAALVVAVGTLCAWAWAHYKHFSFRDHALPLIFMNSAYLGIPVNTFFWGERGALYTIIFSAAVSVFHFTFGVWVIDRNRSLSSMFKLPFIYSLIIGVALSVLSVPVPGFIALGKSIVTAVTLPVMLFLVGFRLGKVKPSVFEDALEGAFLRVCSGWIAAIGCLFVCPVDDPVIIGVCLMASSMPAAINNFIFAEKFKSDMAFASASIFIGTLLSLFTIPFTRLFLLRYIFHL